jgi:hypothetical protein
MVAGLKFLSKKGFNPANLTNQKAVWEARQQKEQENKRVSKENSVFLACIQQAVGNTIDSLSHTTHTHPFSLSLFSLFRSRNAMISCVEIVMTKNSLVPEEEIVRGIRPR